MEYWKIENNRLYLTRFDKAKFSLELIEDTRKYIGPDDIIEILNMVISGEKTNIEQVTEEETEELREYYETLAIWSR